MGFASAARTVTESDGSQTVTLSLNIAPALLADSKVSIASADGTALAGSDYTALSREVVLTRGETSADVTLQILGDDLNESSETFTLALAAINGAPYRLSTGTLTVTITDDDADTSPGFGSPDAIDKTYRIGSSVSLQLPAASGGNAPLDYAVSPALPSGLSFDSGTRRISGTPDTATARKQYTLTVTDGDSDSDSFSFHLFVPSNAAALSALEASAGSLDPAFASATELYALSVPHGNAGITLKATASESNATITVDGAAVASGSASQSIALVPGAAKSIAVVVTAEDGVARKTYTVTATRALAVVGFASASHSVTESDGSQSITLSLDIAPALLADSKVSIASADGTALAGSDYTALSREVALTRGATSANVTVQILGDDLNESSETFTLALAAISGAPYRLSTSILTVTITDDDADTSPGFDNPSAIDETYRIGSSVSLQLPAASGGNAPLGYTVLPALPSGLSFDSGTRRISGTPDTATARKQYTLTVTDGDSDSDSFSFHLFVPSNAAALSALEASAGSLDPAFTSTTGRYALSVPHGNAEITLKATASEGNAAITVNGAAVASGSASQSIALVPGAAKSIAVVVTAEDGVASKTYTVTATRALAVVGFASSTRTVTESDGSQSITLSLDIAPALLADSKVRIASTDGDSALGQRLHGAVAGGCLDQGGDLRQCDGADPRR